MGLAGIAATLGVTGDADSGILLGAEEQKIAAGGLSGDLVQGIMNIMTGGAGHDCSAEKATGDSYAIG